LVRTLSSLFIVPTHNKVNHIFSLSHGDDFCCITFKELFCSDERLRVFILSYPFR
jgi:hypothetical protein